LNAILPFTLCRFGKVISLGLLGSAACCFADSRVIVSASAEPGYTTRKFEAGKYRPETYVVMEGRFFEGHIRDKSIERTPFRKIIDLFAPELARREYWPAENPKDADLLLVVHWGTTAPQASMVETMARTSNFTDTSQVNAERQARIEQAMEDVSNGIPILIDPVLMADEGARIQDFDLSNEMTERISTDLQSADIAQLLGYTKTLRKYGLGMGSTAEEASLRFDLRQARYFIILRAYDLRAATKIGRSRPVWSLHLNMGSPGNNFSMAVARMSVAAVDFVGRSTETVETTRPKSREGKVEVGVPVIVHDQKK
jgi:hypothetical protein